MNDNLDDIDLKFPDISDTLFGSTEDSWNNACLSFAPNRWDIYALGFKQAGDILVSHAIKTRSHIDTLIYPITFSYRHHIELKLKEIILTGCSLIDKDPPKMSHHRLTNLWINVKNILFEAFEKNDTATIKNIDNLIKELESIDPNSMSFRYPTDKTGSSSTPNIRHINIRNLRDTMAKLESFLECISSALSAYLEHKIEFNSYYEDNEY